MTEPAAVLFDFAGTLFDDRGVLKPDRLVTHARRRGLALDRPEAVAVIERALAYIDVPEREAEKDGSDLSADAHRTVWTGLMAAAGPYEPDLADALYACMNDTDSWWPYPDTLPVLQALAAGCQWASSATSAVGTVATWRSGSCASRSGPSPTR